MLGSERLRLMRKAGGYCLIAGSTASGKSALAMALAERVGGVIVNADSVQLYRSLPTLTARPSLADEARVPHRLYGILDDDETGSVARWLDLAVAAIRAAQPRPAIVVGGTGFYLEALHRGQPSAPATPPELRAASVSRYAALGPEGFAAELARLDRVLAARGLPLDRQRRLRAWEVVTLTGRSLVDWQAAPLPPPELPPWRGGVALVPPPEVLWPRIERRTWAMVEAGALDELAAWRERPNAASSPLAKADGVVELGRHLDGACTLEVAVQATAIKVRRYAKRQRTWLRHRLADLPPATTPGEVLAASVLPVDS